MQSRKRQAGGVMSRPIVIAHHLIWTAYGTWLPNDPRGSGSRAVASDVIDQLGELHFGRKSIQPASWQVRDFYRKAAGVLCHPLLTFDAAARTEIAAAFGEVIESRHYTCYACVIMPDHVHIVIRKHKHCAEEMIEPLQETSRLRLCMTGHRTADHPTWVGGSGWKIFLDHPEEVHRTVRYIENNPLPLGLPIQRWPFIEKYDNWPLHPGHSPNSPYARRLREAGLYPAP
jgi:REP element-mobilizing transposase RayT